MTLQESKDPTKLSYSDLAEIVNSNETLQFLQGMLWIKNFDSIVTF